LKYLFNKYRAAQIILLWAAFFSFSSTGVFAQENSTADDDSSMVDSSLINKHSPKKATIMSAIVPGLGQFYNHKYWKIPVIYAGIGFCTWEIIDNNKKRLAWHIKDVTPDQKELKNEAYLFYERNRELNIILLGGIYVMNIIDATVDGYLFDFDVTKELSLHISPTIYQPQFVGIMCNFRF
jgi:hypothetical protein